MSAALLVDSRCTLGEGVVWCSRRAAWLWTDIEGCRLWLHRPADNTTRSWRLTDRLGSFALCQSGRLLLGLAKQIAIADLDAATGETLAGRTLLELEPGLETRVNDGRTDRAGNFVFGTMSELPEHEPIGSFYQYSIAHGLRRLDLGTVGIPNSICFSPDGLTMYFCDSPRREIMQATYDAAAATVSSIELFADVSGLRGDPDGSIVDANGGLWNAVWGAGVIRRFTPGGLVDRQVPVPARQPTCVAFGGNDLDILAVTSARQGLTDEELATEPLSGGVFAVTAIGAPGLEDTRFDDDTARERA